MSECLINYKYECPRGSNRIVVDENGNIEQVNHYYPYGGLIGNLSTNPDKQKFKYNGKEYETMHGLNTYDYGARQYDPARITWDRMDPLCEKYYHINPYVYCGGNPVSRIDIGGSLIIFINGFHFGDGGSSDYWENVDKKIINHFNDHSTPLYYDGTVRFK